MNDSIFLIVERILFFSSSPSVALSCLANADKSCVNGIMPGVISSKSNSLSPSTVAPGRIKSFLLRDIFINPGPATLISWNLFF